MKSLVKKALHKVAGDFGYDIRRRPGAEVAPELIFPIFEHYSLKYKNCPAPCVFDFWLARKESHQWYKEWFYAADNPTWELDEYSTLLAPGDRVLEIGCHHGFLTMMISHLVGPGGFILSLDAIPENVMITQAQIATNGLGARVVAKNLAGGEKPGFLTFAIRTNSHVDPNNTSGISVPVTTGDLLDAEFGPFNVLKLDVEGFEASVLKGCAGLLKRKPKLILELHPTFMEEYNYGSKLEDVFKLIDADAYKGTLIKRPDFSKVHRFTPEAVPRTDVSYVHLSAK